MSGPIAAGAVGSEDVPPTDLGEVSSPSTSLRSLAVRGSTWTLVEYGGSQVLRLATNIILTRLLVPEAFGLMLVVNAVIQGLDMFSDLGLGQSIIQHKRGENTSFLHTAWTMQVGRGVLLFVASLVIAQISTYVYDDMPELRYLIPACAIGTLINGFCSVNMILLNRRLQLFRLAAINLGVQITTLIFMIAWALVSPTVWALVSAHVVAGVARLVASHTICPGPRARFHWDRAAAWSVFRFGRWIFLSTVFGFVAMRGDAFIFGLFETKTFLGIYAVAMFLNQGMVQALHTISSRVLFPVYSRLAESGPERLRHQMFRMRAVLMIVSVPSICFVVVFGGTIVSVLYDDRYLDAGWILQLLSVGAVASIIGSTIGPVLLAVGDSFRFMLLMALRTVVLLAGMALFGWLYGTVGLIFGVAIPDCITYPILIVMVRKYRVWHYWLDLAGFLSALILIHIGWAIWS